MKCNLRCLRWLPVGLMFCLAFATSAFADGDHDRTQVGSNIIIGADEEVSEATCFGCSIRVRGHVSGDVTAFGGSIVIEDQGQVGGDLTTFGGNLRLGEGCECQRGRDGIRRTDSARSRSHCRRRCDHDGWTGLADCDPPYASDLSRSLCAADRMAYSAFAAPDQPTSSISTFSGLCAATSAASRKSCAPLRS